jgi:hypothetical protein
MGRGWRLGRDRLRQDRDLGPFDDDTTPAEELLDALQAIECQRNQLRAAASHFEAIPPAPAGSALTISAAFSTATSCATAQRVSAGTCGLS